MPTSRTDVSPSFGVVAAILNISDAILDELLFLAYFLEAGVEPYLLC
jgi:hypothetical protein